MRLLDVMGAAGWKEVGMIELAGNTGMGARIKVAGVGGGGGNAVNTMIAAGLGGVEFLVANTDAQALENNRADVRVQLGEKGLGAGANPAVGRETAEASAETLQAHVEGCDMVFITAGMGGGTGTGGAPVVGEIARRVGALTVGVVTKPFSFEGKKRQRQAEEGIERLQEAVDTLIVIPNQRLLETAARNTSMIDAFRMADDILFQAVRGISDLVTVHGLINLDFADVRTIMSEMGMAIMGSGTASGENRAIEAAQKAIRSPLLEDISISGARGVLINITGNEQLSLFEVNEASTLIQEEADEEANIIFGAVIDPSMGENLRITVIATGFADRRQVLEPVPVAVGARLGGGMRARISPVSGDPGRPVRRLGIISDDGGEPTLRRYAEDSGEFTINEDGGPEDELDTPAFLRAKGSL
jgi:cell division protein FtsZ